MIHNPKKFMEGIWNWDILIPAIKKANVRVSDVDGVLEYKGEFLHFETKGKDVQTLPEGQRILFTKYTHKNIFTIVMFGDKDQPERFQIFSTVHPKGSEIVPCDLNKIIKFVEHWQNLVDAKKSKI